MSLFYEGFQPKILLLYFCFFEGSYFLIAQTTINYNVWRVYSYLPRSNITKDGFDDVQVIIFKSNFLKDHCYFNFLFLNFSASKSS